MSPPRRFEFAPCWLPLVCALAGCANTDLPTLCNPGSQAYQVAVAKKFDPYPDPTVGGDMTGARPRDYTNPRANPDETKLQPFIAGPAAGPPASAYPPAAAYPPAPYYSYPAGSAPAPAVYPLGAAPAGAPIVYPPGASPGGAAPPPGAVYLPGGATAPPLGTTSPAVAPASSGMAPLAPIPAAPLPTSNTLPSSAPGGSAYGTAINASSP
ncbi:MAG TPA: hypothetical protein VMJ32_00675 [Pirellulales bacterium]|nr:hypothetical protein [Pirellulales bacterium]